jgi:hypothetical protein
VTSRLRELIKQLGEAIHVSVSENEQINHVVQEIRDEGYDVVMMLEATFGLTEASDKDETGETLEGEATPDGGFTQNDLHFLRSLRIAVEGEVTTEKETGDAAETNDNAS